LRCSANTTRQRQQQQEDLADGAVADEGELGTHLREMVCQAECRPRKSPKKTQTHKEKSTQKKPKLGKRHQKEKEKEKERGIEGHRKETEAVRPAAAAAAAATAGGIRDGEREREDGGGTEEVTLSSLETELTRIREARAHLYEQESLVFEQLQTLLLASKGVRRHAPE
jgi:hypothetical protein